MTAIITAEGLVKTYGGSRALDHLYLEVPEGRVLGLLGPNGAGKTTAVRILTTLVRPDAGRAVVAGHDVVKEPDQVRRLIGLSGQYAAVDGCLTGRENLELFGRLYHLGARTARGRAAELLERFELTEAANRPVRTYSGGMRRRLDLAASLIARPRVIALDEPTTGLDLPSRLAIWDTVNHLVKQGATALLTTQYLEEADQLANRIVVIDHGRVIAEGTADQLKAQVGGERLEIVVHDPAWLPMAAWILGSFANCQPAIDEHTRRLVVPFVGSARELGEITLELDARGVVVDDIALRRPTMDDVFLALTGRSAAGDSEPELVTPVPVDDDRDRVRA